MVSVAEISMTTASADSAVIKAMAVLEAFRDDSEPLGVRALSRKVGLPKSTVHRLLSQMESAGFLEREGARYRVGLKLFEIGNYAAFCEPGGMRDTALPVLSDLFSRGGDCVVTFGVLSQDRILCIEKIRGHQSPRTESRVGRPLPSTNSCLGKSILAFAPPEMRRAVLQKGLERSTEYSINRPDRYLRELESIRETGIAVDQQESILGLSGVAAPVFMHEDIVAGIAITYRTPQFRLQYSSQLVRTAATQLSKALDRGATRRAYVPLPRIS